MNPFEILQRAQQYDCRALYKFQKDSSYKAGVIDKQNFAMFGFKMDFWEMGYVVKGPSNLIMTRMIQRLMALWLQPDPWYFIEAY